MFTHSCIILKHFSSKNFVNTTNNKPDKAILVFLLSGIHLSAIPLYSKMPTLVILLIATFSLWQLYIILKAKTNPGKLIQLLTISLSFIVTLYSYGHIFGQQPGIALVTLMTILKLFESKTSRDCYIIIYSAFFIIASNFFHSQSIWLILYVFFVVIFLVSILITLSDKLKTISLKNRFSMAARFILYSLPLMIILFVLFPRIPGPLWGLPDDAFSGITGISETMSPGSINRLISSSEIAFRVKFEDRAPQQNQLYWRGAVLSIYDGETWWRDDAPASTLANIQYGNEENNAFNYTVTLEPTNLNWLLSLEYPEVDHVSYANNAFKLTREAMLTTSEKVTNVQSYTLSSNLSSSNRGLFTQESYKNRLLPANKNPQTIALANKILQSSAFNSHSYVNNVLNYFRDNNFIYTLSPDLLGENAMDDFLFNSQRGFCEHYASAFTYLMRAAGIPARVVIGYQGGTMNPLDNYMIVRQSDAHAWSEVWLDNRWLRIDPTATVSPDRIEQGITFAGLERGRLPALLMTDYAFIKNMSFLYDSFQHTWNQWVIGFNQKKQNDLLNFLGFENVTPTHLILLLLACLTVAGAFVSWLLLTNITHKKDDIQHYYNLFCLKLKRHGLQRQLNEGPVDFENRITHQLSLTPETKNNLTFIFKAYRNLHYGKQANNKLKQRYIKTIKTFRLKIL